MKPEERERLARVEAEMADVRQDMAELRADVKEILAMLAAARGGWVALLLVGAAAAGALGAAADWVTKQLK